MTNHIMTTHAITNSNQADLSNGQGDSKAHLLSDQTLAASLTRTASAQTYYTVRFLVDRDLIPDAFRAYAYFRWVDDTLDQGGKGRLERIAFANRQAVLMDRCYRADWPNGLVPEESMLVEIIRNDRGMNSGLQSYIRNMMAVMVFDAERRYRLVSQDELAEYSRWLATSVTEALHHFIGHSCDSPRSEARYLAAAAAHITHMLRDTYEDAASGYYNIPREYVEKYGIAPHDIASDPYRAWVRSRVIQAREYFRVGKDYLAQVESRRCRLAGFAYIARFEWVLDAIERDNYLLRPAYQERKRLPARAKMVRNALLLAISSRPRGASLQLFAR